METKPSVKMLRILFLGLHACCLLVFVPAVWRATTVATLCLALGAFLVRKFALTAGFHRYFAHRSYKTSRVFQFVLAWLGASAAQKGVLWWVSQHRHHHQYSDQDEDVHSPARDGFWWAHLGWVISSDSNDTREHLIKDLLKFPELRWLERNCMLPFAVLGGVCFLIDGWAGLVWGTVVSTVLLYHTTFAINSFCHIFGRQRFPTHDTSKNSLVLALVTLGEGWHNNHHFYPSSVKQGFYWWEVDITYYVLRLLAFFRIVWDLKKPPKGVLEMGRLKNLTSEMVESLRGSTGPVLPASG